MPGMGQTPNIYIFFIVPQYLLAGGIETNKEKEMNDGIGEIRIV